MSRILFLTLSYPDFRKSATVLCTHRVMEACAESSGMDVHCMCLRYKGEKAEETINGIRVHRIPRTLFETLKYEKSSGENKWSKFISFGMGRIQKLLTVPLYPCDSPFQLRLWNKYGKKLFETISFDCLIAEHYGYNTLQTGLCLKRLYPFTKFVPLLWDPVCGQEITSKLPKLYTTRKIKKIEDSVGHSADMIVSTQAMRKYYLMHGDSCSEKRRFLDIPSILKPEDEVSTEYLKLIKPNVINIVFSGYIDSHRDPSSTLDLLNKCKFAEKLNVLFFCRGMESEKAKYWEDKFNGSIIFHDYIPLQQLHTIYRHADYLLNISSLNPNLIPSKIFEYMSFGKPVISTYKSDGDSAKKYLDKYPESCVIDLKKDIVDKVLTLEGFFEKEHSLVDFKLVQNLFPNNTPSEYVKAIKSLIFN